MNFSLLEKEDYTESGEEENENEFYGVGHLTGIGGITVNS